MIIDLKAVLQTPRRFDINLKPDWWKEKDVQVSGLAGPLSGHINVSRVGNKYEVEGVIGGEIFVKCDRCLDVYRHIVDSEFSLFLVYSDNDDDQDEIELLDDDMPVDFIDNSKIDLDDIIREQIYLSLPMKCLCAEKCLGLCLKCGTNLNKEKCKCQTDKGHPGFSRLNHLKIEGD